MHASTLGDPPADRITPSEYAHILTLIEADSSQLSSVLDEMATFRFEMEDHFSTITLHSTLTLRAHRATLSVFRALDHMVTTGVLRAHMDAELAFTHRWEILRESLTDGMEELVGLGAVYNGFVAAYDAMCLELERRRGVESEIGYVMQEAEKRVESLRQDDMKQRESFKTEHGEYLPADIWPDLVQTERQWRWVAVPEADNGDDQDVREDNEDGLGAQHEEKVPVLPNTSPKITPRRTTIVEERKNID